MMEPTPVENEVFTRLDARHGADGGDEVRASWYYEVANSVAGIVTAVDDALHLALEVLDAVFARVRPIALAPR